MDSANTGVWEDGDGGLMARRRRLRAFVDTVLDTMEALPPPDTYLEAERALKAAKAADKVYTQLNNAPRRPNWTDYDPCIRDRSASHPAPMSVPTPKATPDWSYDPDLEDDEREALRMSGRISPDTLPAPNPTTPPARRLTLGDLDTPEPEPQVKAEPVQAPSAPPLPNIDPRLSAPQPTAIAPSPYRHGRRPNALRRKRHTPIKHAVPTQIMRPLRANYHPP